MTKQNKPLWEASVNTAAIVLTGSGVLMLQGRDYFGLVLIVVALGIEWFKYSNRFK